MIGPLLTQNAIFQVYGGVYRQRSLSISQTVRTLSEIYIHPHYEASSFNNDIALAKLDRPFPLDSFTTKACLPKDKIGLYRVGNRNCHPLLHSYVGKG